MVRVMLSIIIWLLQRYYNSLTPEQQAAIKKTIADMPTPDEQKAIDDGKKPWYDDGPER